MKRTIEIKFKPLKDYVGLLTANRIFEIISSKSINNTIKINFSIDYINDKITLTEKFERYNDKNPLDKKQMKEKLIPYFKNIKITKVTIKEEK